MFPILLLRVATELGVAFNSDTSVAIAGEAARTLAQVVKIAGRLSRRKRGQRFNPPLGGYWRVDLHTSYDITPRGADLRDRQQSVRPTLFGTFFNLEAGNSAASADPVLGDDFFSNPRTITPPRQWPPVEASRFSSGSAGRGAV